mmetsp:Transcript_36459/g.55973  ORF Transcript_36459/g.55973 Transcript_36459/m.55973 type:complete len:101 (+) Transcript_36459:314-616(+)|eukprot:CAMPEP_0170505236 /NCGR_PEP_ID=MMETSP0208-20121228/50256_1 /TAXON_ID=197538 /ORGANISM="Strombidium inclinatum, Strain S3" /LENGTH=100 /DNA_ID=CAMNT_0010785965 /DNA_START=296 /DNA_END=598 /DNA_ORIENTATION=-
MLHDGKLEGKGTLYDKETGDFYCGGFSSQKKEGFGMVWFGSSSKQPRIFELDLDFEYSTTIDDEAFEDSVRPLAFKGEFKADIINGEGIMLLKNGDILLS